MSSIYKLDNSSFGMIMSFLGTPEDLEACSYVSKHIYQVFRSNMALEHVRFLDARHSDDSSLKFCCRYYKLKNLDVSYNLLITQVGLRYLCQMPLFGIKFSCCHIIEEEVPSLPSTLQHLDLSEFLYFSGRGLDHLPKSLTALNLCNCKQIKDEHLAALPQLKLLDLSECDFVTGVALSRLQSLTYLNLNGCIAVTSEAVSRFPSTLVHLVLSKCSKVKDEAVFQLSPSLTHLDLEECSLITEAIFPSLTKMPLQSLQISLCRIKDLGFLPELEDLYLFGCTLINDQALTHLNPKLRDLDLGLCGITDKGLSHLSKNLQRLSLYGCISITDKGIAYLSQSLTSLNLSYCEKISDQALRFLPRTLLELMLKGCKRISDHGLTFLPDSLRFLYLDACNLTDQGLNHLQNFSLEILGLSFCQNITNQGLLSLQKMPLRSLYLKGCQQITNIALDGDGQKTVTAVRKWLQGFRKRARIE